MSIVNTLQIYEVLKREFADAPAKAITEVIEKSLEEYRKNQREFLATKQDLAELKAELIKWMFIFIFGQFWLIIGTITGILFAFFRR